MRRYSISEMDERAASLASQWGMGLEIIDFCIPENLESEAAIEKKRGMLAPFKHVSLHAPYYEIFPSAIDPMIRSVAMHRLKQALEACRKLGVRRMVVHSGYAPQMYYPQWFVPKSIEFWREFVQYLPENFELLIENVLDVLPDYIAEVCDSIADSRVKICLDLGHANAYSDLPVVEWIKYLGDRIAHVHLHNNNGIQDEHAPPEYGSMDIAHLMDVLDAYAPDASVCIESLDAPKCLTYLAKEGFIDV